MVLREHMSPYPKCTSFVGLLMPYRGQVQYLEDEEEVDKQTNRR